MSCFDQAFAAVIGEEGGYSNSLADPGGETKFGISRRAHPTLNIAALTLDQAKAIYRAGYWDKVACDSLPPPLALLVFDAAVNNGPGAAAKWLQSAAGVQQDGVIGPATIAAVRTHRLADLLAEFQAQRMLFQLTLPTVRTFGLGWARRLARTLLGSMAFEDDAVPPLPAELPPNSAGLSPVPAELPPPAVVVLTETLTTEELNAQSLQQAQAARPQ